MAHGIKLIGVRADHERVQLGVADNVDDARAEGAFYLEDPLDTIQCVYLWDIREEQYRGWVARKTQTYTPVTRRRHDTFLTAA